MATRKFALIAVCAVGLGALGSASFVNTAEARGVAAAAGKAVNPNDTSCFWLLGGGVQNVCSTSRSYEVALPTDGSGNKTVQVTTSGGSSCYAFSIDRNALNQDNGNLLSVVNGGNSFLISTYGNMGLNSFGTLVAGCSLGPTGRMQAIDWNQ